MASVIVCTGIKRPNVFLSETYREESERQLNILIRCLLPRGVRSVSLHSHSCAHPHLGPALYKYSPFDVSLSLG